MIKKRAAFFILLAVAALMLPFSGATKSVYAKAKNANDIKELQKIISIQKHKDAKVSSNLGNKIQYKWDKQTGRLKAINWKKKNLKGKINFNSFKGLKYIDISKNSIKSIKIGKVKNLKELDCSYNKISELNLKKHSKLYSLFCSHNRLTKLETDSSMQELSEIFCSNNKITSLRIEGLAMLETLSCSNNKMKELKLNELGDIAIYCAHNELKSLDLSNVSVTLLNCSYNKFETLDFKNAGYVDCSFNNITKLEGNFVNLRTLRCNHNKLKSLEITQPCDYLEEVWCQENDITDINFSGIESIKNVVCDKKVNLNGLIKNAVVKRKQIVWEWINNQASGFAIGRV